jgi:AAA15 family ATPase/GTPase
MLITFRVDNFLSFNAEIEFSMLAGQVRQPTNHVITHGTGRSRVEILKTAVIYGANASGKSNLIKAMDFGKQVILRGIKNVETHNLHFRLDATNIAKPSKFEYEFKVGDTLYAYGFSVHLATKTLLEEWLFEVGKTKDKPIFERTVLKNGKSSFVFSIKFDKKSDVRFSVYQQDILNTQLLLTELADKDLDDLSSSKPFEETYNWFAQHLEFGYNGLQTKGLDLVGQGDDWVTQFEKILNLFNIGLSGIKTELIDWEENLPIYQKKVLAEIINNLPANRLSIQYFQDNSTIQRYSILKDINNNVQVSRLLTTHKLKNDTRMVDFDFTDESDGTNRVLDLIPFLLAVTNPHSTVIIDELDRNLHPELSRKLLEVFFELTKNVDSQLIVTTHESSLLDLTLLRRDEIWFTEKNSDGESTVYSLEEYKPRFDNDVRKAYLMGRFGATPNIENVHNFNVQMPQRVFHAAY